MNIRFVNIRRAINLHSLELFTAKFCLIFYHVLTCSTSLQVTKHSCSLVQGARQFPACVDVSKYSDMLISAPALRHTD